MVLKFSDTKHVVFINFEDIDFKFIKSYTNLNDYIVSKMIDDKKYYLFFDEIQYIASWELVINSLRLRNTDIYITGSNSKLLSSELSTNLARRYVQFQINPLSYKEFVSFRIKYKIPPLYYGQYLNSIPFKTFDNNQLSTSWDLPIFEKTYLDDYLILGGFPFVAAESFNYEIASKIVYDINSSIVLKDVLSCNNIKNIVLLEGITTYFFDNIGSLTTLRKISKYISGGDKNKIESNLDTISKYIHFLEAAYIIKKVSRYDIKGKKLFESNDKYYLSDHSLAYVFRDISKVNKGAIIENVVFNELISRGYKVYTGKLNEKEIDFIAQKNDNKIYIQVSLDVSLETVLSRELTPLKEIKDNYPKYLVCYNNYFNTNIEGIIVISLVDFLLKT
ncbi:MAG: ATP-binding protein [Acholeplasmatales bacterium]|jgi:predicted AAA+ superfamily ATPase|nr:ATP-binding protein [Acholeplasmatales bacterium]